MEMEDIEEEKIREFREAYGGDTTEVGYDGPPLPVLECFDHKLKNKLSMHGFHVSNTLHDDFEVPNDATRVDPYKDIMNIERQERLSRHHESLPDVSINYDKFSCISTSRRSGRNRPIPVCDRSVEYFEAMGHEREKQLKKKRLLSSSTETSHGDNQLDQHTKFMLSWKTSLRNELGIVLDSRFEKQRQRRNALNIAFRLIYIRQVENGWQRWKDYNTAWNERNILRSTLIIQRVTRGFMGRRRAMKIKQIRIFALEAARKREEEERLRIQRAAEKIAHIIWKYSRDVKRRRNHLMLQAVSKIQRVAREMLSRMKSKRAELERTCCVIIQCFWRIVLAKRHVRTISLIRAADANTTNKNLSTAATHRGYMLDGASTTLSLAYSSHKLREGLKLCAHLYRDRLVIPIQGVIRGWLIRLKYKQMFRKNQLDRLTRHRKACEIQRIIRGYLTRNIVYNELKLAFIQERREKRTRKERIIFGDSIPSRVKKTMITFLRSIIPFRYVYEIHSATKIQRIWRGYRGRKSALRSTVNKKIKSWYKIVIRQQHAAIMLQKCFRGFALRKSMSRKSRLGLDRIQSVWRGYAVRKRMKDHLKRKIYTEYLCRVLYKFALKLRSIRWEKQRATHGVHSNIIVNAARRYLQRKDNEGKWMVTRQSHEMFLVGSLATIRAISSLQMKLLTDSMNHKKGARYKNACGEACPCLDPIVAIFVTGALGSKGKTDNASLDTNRIASIDCLRFVQEIGGIVEDNNNNNSSSRSKGKGRSETVVDPSKLQSTLLSAYSLGIVEVSKVVNKINASDVDIQFNGSRDRSEGMGTLNFEEFKVFMSRVGSKVFEGLDHDGPTTDHLSHGLHLFMMALISLFNKDWARCILRWMELESQAQLDVYIRRIQTLAKSHRNKMMKGIRNQIIMDKRMLIEKEKASKTIKKVLIGYLSKLRVKKMAQKRYIKYIPVNGHPYWYNPSTQKQTFKKPSLLSNSECITIALPPTGFEYVALCPNCGDPAELNCTGCDESFCNACFHNLHSKGTRKSHRTTKIPYCSYCHFQMATKSCSTCMLMPPQAGTAQELVTDNRGMFCDTCFTYLHDERVLQTNGSSSLVPKDTYLVGQSVQEDVSTDHVFTNLVENCEECGCRAASWRCDDCSQLYCSRCLLVLHSLGGIFAKHAANPLPYYTPDMHAQYELDNWSFKFKNKMDLMKHNIDQKIKERYRKCTLKIQTWWRMLYYRRTCQAYFRKCRRKTRLEYRIRNRENRLRRQNFGFQLANFLGLAPVLSSDTKEETVLRSIPWVFRHRARQYIWRNMEDWGFSRKLGTQNRKGIPKTGFEVGDIGELKGQAKYGGYRMPGTITVRNGYTRHTTKYNLTNFIQSGVLLRVKNNIFVCVNVLASCEVTLDKNWSHDDGEEILYLLPSFKGQVGRRFFKFLHWGNSLIQNNLVVQTYASIHVNLTTRIAKFGSLEALKAKKHRKMKSFVRWSKFAETYKRRAQWGKNLVVQYDSTIDLSESSSPEEILAAREAEELAKKLEREKQDEIKAQRVRLKKQESMKALQASKRLSQKSKKTRSKTAKMTARGDDGDDEEDVGYTQEEDKSEAGSSKLLNQGVKYDKEEDKPEGWFHKSKDSGSSGGSSSDSDDESGHDEEDRSGSVVIDNTDESLDESTNEGKKEPWKATEQQLFERSKWEATLSRQKLASYADEWIQYIDPLTDNEYYINKNTNELSHVVPASVAMKEQLENEDAKNKRDYDEAQQRLEKLSKLSKGGRKMVVRK